MTGRACSPTTFRSSTGAGAGVSSPTFAAALPRRILPPPIPRRGLQLDRRSLCRDALLAVQRPGF
jgi:hypothetical protein